MAEHPPIHVVVYGQTGTRKTTFLGTFPKPILAFFFDPFGKDAPLLKLGTPTELSQDVLGTPIREVHSSKGKLLAHLEYYHETVSTFKEIQPIGEAGKAVKRKHVQTIVPSAWSRFLKRMAHFQDEYDQWATVGFDSVTMAELVCRKHDQYVLNPSAADPRQWWGGSTDQLEELLMLRFGSLPMNVVVLCHQDEDKDELHGSFVRNPKLPGRLRSGIAAGYGELYHAYVAKDGQTGERAWLLQTQTDHQFIASSQIGAPDPCLPHYKALWEGGA